MIALSIYIIIGVLLFTRTSVSMARRDINTFKANIKTVSWWAATIFCALVWPAIVIWAIYDAVKLTKEIEL